MNKNIPKYVEKKFVVIFLVRVLFITKKVAKQCKGQNKKRIMTIA